MSVIRVNPDSVRQYAAAAGERFGVARAELEAMVREAAGVRYFGHNAVQFKQGCGQLAADYSTRLLADITAIAEAVRSSTSNIAASLGGQPVAIAVDGAAVVPPAVAPADAVVDVDVSALEALKPAVTGHIAAVHAALRDHLTSLTSTDWEGAAKTSAVDAVSRFTNQAQARATEAEAQINAFIDAQISSVMAADR